MWVSSGTLKTNEYYVVHIDYTVGNKAQSIFKEVKQGTSFRIDPSTYPGANPNGTRFSWYVVIVSQTPKSPTQNSETFAQSPASVTWTFAWY
jgi:hypothetical protein